MKFLDTQQVLHVLKQLGVKNPSKWLLYWWQDKGVIPRPDLVKNRGYSLYSTETVHKVVQKILEIKLLDATPTEVEAAIEKTLEKT